MKPRIRSILKHAVQGVALLAVIGAGAHFFEHTLRALLPQDLAARSAREARVATRASLGKNEEVVEPGAVRPAALPAAQAVSDTTLVVKVRDALDAGTGASSQLEVQIGACPPGALQWQGEQQLEVSLTDQPQLESSLTRTVCVAAQSGSDFNVSPLSGTWSADSTEVPVLEQKMQQLRFVTPSGQAMTLTAWALGYCESEEGGCASSLGVATRAEGSKTTAHLEVDGDSAELSLSGAGR